MIASPDIVAIVACVLASIPCTLFLVNLGVYRRTHRLKGAPLAPVRTSILIPARNEEANIGTTLQGVLSNPGDHIEVLVLDDGSTDGTSGIVRRMALQDPRLRLAEAPPLPPGWCGKQHACHVLSTLASGNHLVFLDADVRLGADAIARMGRFLQESGVALASGVPRQETVTFSERLLIPLIHFILMGFLPMPWMKRTRDPAFSAGCGQLFIADAAAYRAAGGHAAICDTLHDGIRLPRLFRKAGFATGLFDPTDIATCRMYRTDRETWLGLGKNATEGLAAPGTLIPMTCLLAGGQILPFLLAALALPIGLSQIGLAATVLGMGMAYLPRVISVLRFRQPLGSAFLHPFGVAALLAIQWKASLNKRAGKPSAWKGRLYGATPGPAVPCTHRGQASLHTLILLLTLLALNRPGTCLAKDPPLRLESFTLSDQFGTNHSVRFPSSQPTILLVGDRAGAPQLEPWISEIKRCLGSQVAMTGVADVTGVPGFLRGMIRSRFRERYTHPILLDFSGSVSRSLPLEKSQANIFVIEPSGAVLTREHGVLTPEALQRLTNTVHKTLSKPGE